MGTEKRTMPMNDLDLQYMLTDPDWGRDVPEELKNKLKHQTLIIVNDENGNPKYKLHEESLWELLSFYTKEIRLAYINKEEFDYCSHNINLAGDCLNRGLIKSFMKALRNAITTLELSQSKGGFLRKRHGTIRTEQGKEEDDEKQISKGFNFKSRGKR